jgi:hypothetical protein
VLISALPDDPALLKDARVYALADMFFLPDLKALCTLKLTDKLHDQWSSESFPDCIREIYESTPQSDRTMKDAVVRVAKQHARELAEKDIFKDLIREGGDFPVDYLESLIFGGTRTNSTIGVSAGFAIPPGWR